MEQWIKYCNRHVGCLKFFDYYKSECYEHSCSLLEFILFLICFLEIAYSWVLSPTCTLPLKSDSLYILRGAFSLFEFNVIIDMAGFKSTISSFILCFYIFIIPCFSVLLFLPYFGQYQSLFSISSYLIC